MLSKKIFVTTCLITLLFVVISFIIGHYYKSKTLPVFDYKINVGEEKEYIIEIINLFDKSRYRIDLIEESHILSLGGKSINIGWNCKTHRKYGIDIVDYFKGAIKIVLFNQNNEIIEKVSIDNDFCRNGSIIEFINNPDQKYYLNIVVEKPDKNFQEKVSPELVVAYNERRFSVYVLFFIFEYLIPIILIGFLGLVTLIYFFNPHKYIKKLYIHIKKI